ncbi:hypothetical protein ACX1C1_16230 [Paenibacillus sp. strain BS8-2]
MRTAYTVQFLHLDELPADLPVTAYPCVFLRADGEVKELVTAEEMNRCSTIVNMKELVEDKLREQSFIEARTRQ